MRNPSLSIPSKYTTPIAFSPKGKPVYLIAGGEDDPNNPVVVPPAVPAVPVASPTGPGETTFSQADLNAAVESARQQEKDKLYGKVSNLETKLTEIAEREAAQVQEQEQARLTAEAAQRAAEEEELSARELLTRKDQEWQARLTETEQSFSQKFEAMKAEREQEQALLAKEQQFTALQAYKNQRLADEVETIAPQFHPFVGGNTQEDIEASITLAKEKSAEVAAQVQAAMAAAAGQQRGVSITGFPPVGPVEFENGQRQLSAQDIANMPMEEYAKNRGSLIGNQAANKGIFG